MKIGLVLEGGGTKAAYTAGILQWFIDHKIEFEYSVGISSASALLLAFHLKNESYLKDMATKFASDPRFFGWKALLKEKSLFGLKYGYNELLDRYQIDLNKYISLDQKIETGLFNLETGEDDYYSQKEVDDVKNLLMGACALPLVAPIHQINGKKYLDGGIVHMIPIERAIEQDLDKFVVITSKEEGYVRKLTNKYEMFLIKHVYKKYPKLYEKLLVRPEAYVNQWKIIDQLVKENRAFVIRPKINLKTGRYTTDSSLLERSFQQGYDDIEKMKDQFLSFMEIKNG